MQGYRPKFEPIERSGHKLGRFAKIVNRDGFITYADGDKVDLHKELTGDKSSICLMPVDTNIMRNSGLHNGNMVVVDRAMKPERGDIVVVRYNDMIVTRKIEKSLTCWALVADDPREEKLLLGGFADYQLIGVVVHTIKSFKRKVSHE